ncbi:hypothetical protein ACET3Z_003284 [Daucus carota]
MFLFIVNWIPTAPNKKCLKLKPRSRNLDKIHTLSHTFIMQPTGNSANSGLSRGLARFRSAPATWLEALLESEEEPEEEEDAKESIFHPSPAKPPPPATHYFSPPETMAKPEFLDPELLRSSPFLRQNSSPAEFLGQISPAGGSDAYFSNFGVPASYDSLSSTKRPREKGEKSGEFNGVDADMQKLFEDSVPCRIRAKRGCATHPRSIAERVRRTRISDRIRKLQELVPNMDKQTNTADMLDEAVEYVKLLQKQIQELKDHQKTCICAQKY